MQAKLWYRDFLQTSCAASLRSMWGLGSLSYLEGRLLRGSEAGVEVPRIAA